MALTLISAQKVKQNALGAYAHAVAGPRSPGVTMQLAALFQYLSQHKKNPDLQIVPFAIAGADIVIADVTCKLYALVAKKPAASTTDAWLKGSDHATVAAAAGDLAIKFVGSGGGNAVHGLIFPDGLTLATGLTIAQHTAVDGNTDSSAADRCAGFAIVGS
jgi:hypothetical protein